MVYQEHMVNCRGKTKCYRSSDKKKCSTPNAWVIFLRSVKGDGLTVKEAARYYQHVFKPQLIRKLIAIAGENAPLKKQKAEYHKLICKKFYETMKAENGAKSAQKKKLSSGVAKILKKNSIPETLASIGAKKAAAALKKKEAAIKKAAADVAAKEKAVREQQRKAASVIKKALVANVKAKKLAREAADAKKKEAADAKKRSRSSSSSSTGGAVTRKRARANHARSPGNSSTGGAQKRKAPFGSVSKKKAKTAVEAQRQADNLKKNAANSKKKVDFAESALFQAKKRKATAAMRKLDTNLNGTAVRGKRKRV